MTSSAAWRKNVDFPPMFGPVKSMKRSESAAKCKSLGTKASISASTTG